MGDKYLLNIYSSLDRFIRLDSPQHSIEIPGRNPFREGMVISYSFDIERPTPGGTSREHNASPLYVLFVGAKLHVQQRVEGGLTSKHFTQQETVHAVHLPDDIVDLDALIKHRGLRQERRSLPDILRGK